MSTTDPGAVPGRAIADVRAEQAAAGRRQPTVEELRADLKARGLPTGGTKAELQARLDADSAGEDDQE